MTERTLIVPRALWTKTWKGLRTRGGGSRETACVWVGTRDGVVERAHEVIFLDDLPGTAGRRLQHRTSREAVVMLLSRARDLGMVIVCDIHTHPSDWVDLSLVDQEHPIEYRVGLLALVLPNFAGGKPDIEGVGVHEYAGDGRWHTFPPEAFAARLRLVEEEKES
jgi:proteasome lid subunit RPN8/RPN11